MGTTAFGQQSGATVTTMVTIMRMATIAVQSVYYIGYEQQIAHIVKCKDAEHDIVDSTHGAQASQIEYGIGGRQLATDIVEGSNSNNDSAPNIWMDA